MNNTAPFHAGELEAQARFGDFSIWDDDLQKKLLWEEIPEEFHARLESAPFIFLATSDDKGHCDCSFKGGSNGLIKVISGTQIAFPDFDGNGAFMNIGNILLNPHVGLLFIDFTDEARLRVNGRASIHDTGDAMKLFANAKRAIDFLIVSFSSIVKEIYDKVHVRLNQKQKGTVHELLRTAG